MTYSLGGTDASSFDIDTSNGQLKTKAALDKETKDTYEVTVSVHDGYPDATVDDTIDVTITVTNANDPPTVSGQTTVNHAENDAGTVATYSATDPEGVTTFTWTLSGDDADDFAINDGGALTFDPPPNFEGAADADTNNEYLVTVEASDGAIKGTLDVTVTVTDVNEKPAFDEGPTAARTVAENTAANQPIGSAVEATDPDGDTLTYSLDSTSAASFDIDTSSGQLKTKAALDKEATPSYTVTISVHDGKNAAGGTDTTVDNTITVTITVTDENDSPEFSAASITRTVPAKYGRRPDRRPACDGH